MVVVPSKMGRMNKRTFLVRLQKLGVASRAELAKSLGLSQPTVGKITDELIHLGIVEEISAQAAAEANGTVPGKRDRLGRPGILLRLNRSQPRFLGIQLGVSETSLALLTVGPEAEDRWDLKVKTPASGEAWVQQLKLAAAQLAQKEFWGVLVSVPGIVDEAKNQVLFSPNVHWTEKADFSALIQQVWKAPVMLVQEERALVLGHQFADQTGEDFFLVDIGDGVGGAMIVASRLYANPLPISGELGHTPVVGNQRRCGCGAVGCVETLVSLRGLLQSYAEQNPKATPSWAAMSRHIRDHGVESWLAEALDALAVIIAGSLNVLGLRRIVITGNLHELPPCVMAHLSQAVVNGCMWARFGLVECISAPRRRTSGLVAAAVDRLLMPMSVAGAPDSWTPAYMGKTFRTA